MNLLQKLALVYLLAMAFMGWGFAVGAYKVFPHSILLEFQRFVVGHELEKEISLLGKIRHDLGIVPERFLGSYPELEHNRAAPINVEGMKERRDPPRMFLDPAHASGYRAIFGALDFDDAFWGGVLLGPDGRVLHSWQLSTKSLKGNRLKDEKKNLYGIAMLRDGSVIFSMQEDGGGIVRMDACGNVIWGVDGNFHHTVTPAADDSFWTFMGEQTDFDPKLARISVETGEILSVIDMQDVRAANSDLHIFNLQKTTQRGKIIADATHGNDIEPLSEQLAGKFEMFSAGDLLVSFRTTNLVFVLDPETLKIKWWRVGIWDRQHDPDWEADGSIVTFSNNSAGSRLGTSDIISVDPHSLEFKVVVDGKDFSFYSRINGQHEKTPYNTRIVTSSTQGWIFEVDEENQIVFSFLNTYSDSDMEALHMSDAFRVSENYFEKSFWKECIS